MGSFFISDAEHLMDDVFYKEDRYSAELRLAPEELEQLTHLFPVQCTPLDDQITSDGKRWYLVRRTDFE